jgi:hypothetical protein
MVNTSARSRNYLNHLDLEQLFKDLGAADPRILAKTVRHFTTKEAERRDTIVTAISDSTA